MPKTKPRLASRAARRRAAVAVVNGLRGPEAAYVRALRGVMKAISAEYARFLTPHLTGMARTDGQLPDGLDALGVRIRGAIGPTVGPLFDRMSGAVSKANARGQALMGVRLGGVTGVRGIITNAGHSGVQADILAARDRNIQLIENAHRAYSQQVRDVIEDPGTFGMRVEEIQARIQERGNVSESRAELIARDQTLKLNSQITATRQMRAGVERYTWSTSQDERVREEHAALEGEVFDWTSPPEVGHPGQDFQCRCVAIPVVEELEDVFGD